jgi:2-iminobutanoate/2-iminopropanoate deaminase
MELINSTAAPAAIGPYSHAVRAGNTLYVSGQIPLDPETGTVTGTDMETQAGQALKNLKAVVESAGLAVESIVKTTVFVSDLALFDQLNTVYARFMGEHKPARVCVEVVRLPKDVMVEIDAIATFES